MIDIEQIEIDRITIHRVNKKFQNEDFGFAEYSENIFNFGVLELITLKARIEKAFSKSKNFFKLEIANTDDNSFYSYCKRIKTANNEEFLNLSKSIADLMATSHKKRTIPAGLLLVLDGKLKSKHFVLVIKAELQEAFTIKEADSIKIIELINDLFLSPAKDFYKIGLLIEDRNNVVSPNDLHSCYMYDDNFNKGKRDLAEYFYNDFLGFSTNSNDKLLTKNFRDDVFSFLERNIVDFEDKKGLKGALNTLYRENTTGVINPDEFAKDHFPDELLRIFGSEVASNYPYSFTKDLSLVVGSLTRGHIKLVNDLKIEGPQDAIDNVTISNARNIDIPKLVMQIENGEIDQIITIKTE